MAQRLEALVLVEDLIYFPTLTWWLQPFVTLAPEDLIPSSGLHEHQAHMWCTNIRACKPLIYMKEANKYIKRENVS